MHAFIVRPFGVKQGIDFDRVEAELIRPALVAVGFSGGTTGELVYQGNIRTDMFEQLLIADLVVADISIHNANAFYELGIRHAVRDKRTYLIKSEGDVVPFDLATDRYLAYDADDPAATLPQMIAGLRATWESQKQDSPVFQLLPDLEPTDPKKMIVVPLDFREAVEQAEGTKKRGDLQLLSSEVDGFAWKTTGLRLIGNAQFRLKDLQGARTTWEAVRGYDDMDLEANTLLGTVYQRLGELVKSDQCLRRALESRDTSRSDRAEIWALMGRNAKTEWEREWKSAESREEAQEAALISPNLTRSFDLYCKGFAEDRNHFYSGLNALAMGKVKAELATLNPQIWEEEFEEDDEAAFELRRLRATCAELASGVRLAIESKRLELARDDRTDLWAEISFADLMLLSSPKPRRVGRTYRKALADAPGFASDAARKQILLYEHLGVLPDAVGAALAAIPATAEADRAADPTAVPRVLLFTGHRVDAPGRETPRFPAEREAMARTMIREVVESEQAKASGPVVGLAGGASGGDILFHEVCAELGIASEMYLAIPKNDYIKYSVADAGPEWVERFKSLYDRKRPAVLSEGKELPRWLHGKDHYDVWQRANLWMLHNALEISHDHLTLIALWNDEPGDGPGGTADMVRRAQDRGATFLHLDARKLVE